MVARSLLKVPQEVWSSTTLPLELQERSVLTCRPGGAAERKQRSQGDDCALHPAANSPELEKL